MPLGASVKVRRGRNGAASAPAGRRPRLVRSPQMLRALRRVLRGTLAFGPVVTGYVGVTIYPYVTGPGADSVSAHATSGGS